MTRKEKSKLIKKAKIHDIGSYVGLIIFIMFLVLAFVVKLGSWIGFVIAILCFSGLFIAIGSVFYGVTGVTELKFYRAKLKHQRHNVWLKIAINDVRNGFHGKAVTIHKMMELESHRVFLNAFLIGFHINSTDTKLKDKAVAQLHKSLN